MANILANRALAATYAAALISLVSVAAGIVASRPAAAQSPQPCLPFFPNDPPIDLALDIDLGASGSVATKRDDMDHVYRPVDEVTLRWTADLNETGAECVFVSGADSSFALVRAAPDQQSVSFLASGNPGEQCYRLTAISPDGIGPTSTVCLDIQHPRGPRTPGSLPGECIGMAPLFEIPVRADIAVVAAKIYVVEGSGDQLEAIWPTLGPGPADDLARCVQIHRRGPGETYMGTADVVVAASATSARFPAPVGPGEWCFRFVALANEARGEFSETCFEQQSTPRVTTDSTFYPADSGGFVEVTLTGATMCAGQTVTSALFLPDGTIAAEYTRVPGVLVSDTGGATASVPVLRHGSSGIHAGVMGDCLPGGLVLGDELSIPWADPPFGPILPPQPLPEGIAVTFSRVDEVTLRVAVAGFPQCATRPVQVTLFSESGGSIFADPNRSPSASAVFEPSGEAVALVRHEGVPPGRYVVFARSVCSGALTAPELFELPNDRPPLLPPSVGGGLSALDSEGMDRALVSALAMMFLGVVLLVLGMLPHRR